MMDERPWSSPFSPYVLAILRIVYGILWLQQSTWKVPPDFGTARGDGLYYWTQQMAQYSFLPPHKFFVESVVLPHFLLFAWLTLLTELFIGFSHLLGLLNRLGALAALAMTTNLFIGLARHPAEWPWSWPWKGCCDRSRPRQCFTFSYTSSCSGMLARSVSFDTPPFARLSPA